MRFLPIGPRPLPLYTTQGRADRMKSIIDPYDRKARLQPALLSALPLFICLLLMVPGFDALWGVVSGVITFCGGVTWLAHLSRGRGEAREPQLFRAWDGRPSVAMLRHRDRRLSAADKGRYRRYLGSMVPGLKLATPEDEQQFPEQADDGYQGATSWLLAQTKDRNRFELLFRENVSYGFRRNLWSLKRLALAFDVAAVVIIAIAETEAFAGITGGSAPSETTIFMCTVLTVAHALAFMIAVRTDWVRGAANAYARQLLAACDRL